MEIVEKDFEEWNDEIDERWIEGFPEIFEDSRFLFGLYEKVHKDVFRFGIFVLNPKYEYFYLKKEMKKYNGKRHISENIDTIKNFLQNLDELEYSEEIRALSCIYGAIYGNALGGFCENSKPNKDNHKKIYSSNQREFKYKITDDLEMTFCLAFALMDMPNLYKIDPKYIMYYYGCWYSTNPPLIGKRTRAALEKFDLYKSKIDDMPKLIEGVKEVNKGLISNSFQMRKTPFVVWFYYRYKQLVFNALSPVFLIFRNQWEKKEREKNMWELYKQIRELGTLDDICTHPNEECHSAQAFFNLLSIGAIAGNTNNGLITFIDNFYNSDTFKEEANEFDIKIAQMFYSYARKFVEVKYNCKEYFTKEEPVCDRIGWYNHAFRLTIHYLIHFDEYQDGKDYCKYELIMNEICDFGGDTDTNCAIVGGIIGPLIGYKHFGRFFKSMVELSPDRREFFSPAFMTSFVDFIIRTNNYPENYINERSSRYIDILLCYLYSYVDEKNYFKPKVLYTIGSGKNKYYLSNVPIII